MLNDNIINYLNNNKEETINLIKDLCFIPSPSHHEKNKALFIKNWLDNLGAKDVYIDEAYNVIYHLKNAESNETILFTAHTDTVFPDLTPLPFSKDEKYLYAPGVGDDTTCLAMMLMVIKYIIINNLKPNKNILFVANSCEEGLGNLKGIKQIMNTYENEITEVYCLDSQYDCVINKCVGSHRYEITFKTIGGHSFRDFGNENAIVLMSKLINKLYECVVPKINDSHTTYNVGIVSGGTSINTIAQEAKMLYEYRSDDEECLSIMKNFFEEKIKEAKENKNVTISVETIGIRPCGKNVDANKLNKMTDKIINICEKHSNMKCAINSGSTDANIPMSKAIPSITVGTYLGEGEHTREEKVLIESIPIGLKIVSELILEYFK